MTEAQIVSHPSPASGIAVNSAFWAMNRAQWASAMLASLGVRA